MGSQHLRLPELVLATGTTFDLIAGTPRCGPVVLADAAATGPAAPMPGNDIERVMLNRKSL
jgi:hypothetical protein